MSYKSNAHRFDLIQRFGVTVDLDLFNQPINSSKKTVTTEQMPRRVFNGTTMKAEAYELVKPRLREKQLAVMSALIDLQHATDRELASKLGWEVNRITARRKELQELGLVIFSGEKIGDFGIKNSIWTPDWIRIKALIRSQQ